MHMIWICTYHQTSMDLRGSTQATAPLLRQLRHVLGVGDVGVSWNFQKRQVCISLHKISSYSCRVETTYLQPLVLLTPRYAAPWMHWFQTIDPVWHDSQVKLHRLFFWVWTPGHWRRWPRVRCWWVWMYLDDELHLLLSLLACFVFWGEYIPAGHLQLLWCAGATWISQIPGKIASEILKFDVFTCFFFFFLPGPGDLDSLRFGSSWNAVLTCFNMFEPPKPSLFGGRISCRSAKATVLTWNHWFFSRTSQKMDWRA